MYDAFFFIVFFFQSLANQLKENEQPNSVVNVLVKGGTPFPYKVAKALDPRMYRNVEFDLWNDERKGWLKLNLSASSIYGPSCIKSILSSHICRNEKEKYFP